MSLSRVDWTRAALFALAERGTAGLAVEPLAAALGATKGSFYWHFRNRDELVHEALALWEREGTDDIIEQLERVNDPVERLRLTLEAAMDDESEGETMPADAALLAAAGEPLVAPVVRRVHDKRLVFLERCFRDMSLPPAESRHRARIAYSVYLGWFRQLQGRDGEPPSKHERAAYERIAIELLTAPRS